MRSHLLQKDDTLRNIACRAYYVYDDQGDEDTDRVAIVVRELLKWNPTCALHFQTPRDADLTSESIKLYRDRPYQPAASPSSQRILLPDIPGIARYSALQPSQRTWRWAYLLVWLLGLAVGLLLRFAQPFLSAQLPVALLGQWLWLQLQNVVAAPRLAIDDILLWAATWSLVVWIAWLVLPSATLSPVRQIRLRFLLGWQFGLAVLIFGSSRALELFMPSATVPLAQFTVLFPLAIIWSVLIFLLYLYLGDGSVYHAEYFVPHCGIWTILALMIVGTTLTAYVGYQQVRDRIRGELSALTLAETSLQQLRNSTRAVSDDVDDILQVTRDFGDPNLQHLQRLFLTEQWPQTQRHATTVAVQAIDAQRFVQHAIQYYENNRAYVAAGSNGGAQDQNVNLEYTRQQINALDQISTVLTATVQATSELPPGLAVIEPKRADDGMLMSLTADQRARLERDVRPLVQEAALRADIAADSIQGIGFDGLPILLSNTVLFVVLVLFPWLLLLLFLYRKRSNLAAGIYAALERLDPKHGLLKRVLQGSSTSRERKQVKKLLVEKSTQPSHGISDQQAVARLPETHVNQLPAAASANALVLATQSAGIDEGAGASANVLRQSEIEAIDLLASRTFSEFEYSISLSFLSLLLAVAWYYVFYSQTSIGLTNLIVRGSGVRQLISFITVNLTPLTIGFAGAYLFLTQMLVRRYLANDLYPTAFLQAALRLLVVSILSLALTFLSPPLEGGNSEFTKTVSVPGAMALIVAFLVGIYPTSGLKLIVTTINHWTHQRLFPSSLIQEPLTKLTGVTIWVEARLFEENIESIEAMATAPLEQLIVNTHFPTAQIVDWVDQAILYLHAGHDGEWFAQLRAVGIRGATDLLDAAGLNLLAPYESLTQGQDDPANTGQRHEFYPDPTELERVANAMTAANASGVGWPRPDDPRSVAAGTIDQLQRTADTAAMHAERAATLIGSIEPDKPLTYDRVLMLGAPLDQARVSLERGAVEAAKLAEAAGKRSQDVRRRLAGPVLLVSDALGKAKAHVATLQASVAGGSNAIDSQSALDALHKRFAEWSPLEEAIEQALSAVSAAAAGLPTADLRAAVSQAGDHVRAAEAQARQLDLSQPQTLDACKELAHHTMQVHQLTEQLRNAYKATRAALEDNRILKTPSQSKQLIEVLSRTDTAMMELSQVAQNARDYAAKLHHGSTMAADPKPVVRTVALSVGQAFKDIREQVQALNVAVATITQPPQITVEILYEICDAIWPNPNLSYILNYSARTIKDLQEQPEQAWFGQKSRIEQQLDTISAVLGVATLDNYQGYISHSFQDEKGKVVDFAEDEIPALRAGHPYELVVWFQPNKPERGSAEEIRVTGGTDARTVEFSLVPDSDSVNVQPRHRSISFVAADVSPRVNFLFRTPEVAGTYELWIEVSQKNRLIRVISATLYVQQKEG